MGAVDWLVFAGFVGLVIWDGVRRGRRSRTPEDYLLAGRRARWWAMGLSVMATQASAITLVSTVGKGCRDGTRFAQFYYALPLAMAILAVTAVPWFHRRRVFTAYAWLETRFDRKTRVLTGLTFLVLRTVSAGFVLYAPALVIRVLFDVPVAVSVVVTGALAMAYTAIGGLEAVIATDVKQMAIMLAGLVAVFLVARGLLPEDVGVSGAVRIAEAAGRLELLDLRFDPSDRYNLWSALFGGTFLFLAYFGTDQSQVQRYLAGRSLREKRQALALNALLKVPFQLGVLLIGVVLAAVFLFHAAPITFEGDLAAEADRRVEGHAAHSAAHAAARERAGRAARTWLAGPDREEAATARAEMLGALADAERHRREAGALRVAAGLPDAADEDYVLPWFARTHLPPGLLGLLLAAILAAVFSSIDSALNSVATVAVTDLVGIDPEDPALGPRIVRATRWATVVGGCVATASGLFLAGQESIVEGVNVAGSFFYGALLGVFALAALDRRATGTGAVAGLLAGLLASALVWHGGGAFLWMNTVGTLSTMILGTIASRLTPPPPSGDPA